MISIDPLIKSLKKFIVDRYAIIILVLAVILIPVILVFGFHQTPISIFSFLLVVPNIIYSLIKNFRQKILFKESGQIVRVNKGPKVLVWILDGCNVQSFLEVAKNNDDLKIMFEEGYFAQCSTIFPSITPAAHATLMTGCYPAKTRIPAFDWVDVKKSYTGNESREYVRVMPDYKRYHQVLMNSKYQKEFFAGLGDALDLNQRFLSPFVSTIFETLKEDWYTESMKEWIHRGADSFIGASINNMLDELVDRNLIKERSMIDLLMASYKEVSYEYGDIIWGSACSKQLADLMVYWKTSTDTMSHEYGPRSKQVNDEIDEAIGKLAETIKFYKMSCRQPVYVVITADHGQSEVTKYSDMIEYFIDTHKDRYRMAGRDDLADIAKIDQADIIIANNDRAAFYYIFGSSLEKNEIRDETIKYLKSRTDVDLIIYRDETTHVIQIQDDGAAVESNDIDDFFRDKDSLYPNGAERIRGLVDGNNWGEIVISMKEGYSLNPNFKPEKEGESILHGDHGGLNFNDSIVPFLIWGPTIKANAKNGNWNLLRTVDIAPTIAAIFNETQKVTDGKVLRDIMAK